jgi:hypothetical protein
MPFGPLPVQLLHAEDTDSFFTSGEYGGLSVQVRLRNTGMCSRGTSCPSWPLLQLTEPLAALVSMGSDPSAFFPLFSVPGRPPASTWALCSPP